MQLANCPLDKCEVLAYIVAMRSERSRVVDSSENLPELAARQDKEGLVRIRLQPQVLVAGRYLAWKGTSWSLVAENAVEAEQVRETLHKVCQVIVEYGPREVHKWVDKGELATVESTVTP